MRGRRGRIRSPGALAMAGRTRHKKGRKATDAPFFIPIELLKTAPEGRQFEMKRERG